ncbi:MAG: hypothetical protein RBQ88_11685 [Desulfobulbus oligotrophicus]|nr:hypothetical protein [Desulfobulbus oligotrophicus]
MQRYLRLMMMALLIWSSVPGLLWGDDRPDACLLFSQSDASELLQATVSPGVVSKAVSPAGMSCRYFYKEDGGVFGVTVTHSTSATISEEGIYASAADVMMRQLRARKNSTYAASFLRTFSDLGEESFWDGTALWLRKHDHLVRIRPEPRVVGTFTDRAAADAAKRERSLALALAAGKVIVARLP